MSSEIISGDKSADLTVSLDLALILYSRDLKVTSCLGWRRTCAYQNSTQRLKSSLWE